MAVPIQRAGVIRSEDLKESTTVQTIGTTERPMITITAGATKRSAVGWSPSSRWTSGRGGALAAGRSVAGLLLPIVAPAAIVAPA